MFRRWDCGRMGFASSLGSTRRSSNAHWKKCVTGKRIGAWTYWRHDFLFFANNSKKFNTQFNRSNHFSGLRKYCHGFSHANKSFVEYLIRCLLIVFVAVCPGGGVRRRTIIKLSSPATRKLTQRQRGLGRAAIGLWLGRRQSALSRNGRSASKSQVAVTIVPWTTTATLVAQMSKRGSLLRRLAVPIAPITTQATSATPRIWMATRAIMAMRAGFRWAIRGCSASVARKKLNATMVTPTSWPSSRRSSSPARIHTGPSRLVLVANSWRISSSMEKSWLSVLERALRLAWLRISVGVHERLRQPRFRNN